VVVFCVWLPLPARGFFVGIFCFDVLSRLVVLFIIPAHHSFSNIAVDTLVSVVLFCRQKSTKKPLGATTRLHVDLCLKTLRWARFRPQTPEYFAAFVFL